MAGQRGGSQAAASARNQAAERSARTRERMLDATIDCLVEFGYAGLTTRRIAEATGLTRGAQQHHFGDKAELVGEAVLHLAMKAGEDLVARLRPADGGEPTTEAILDGLWQAHCSPLYEAGIELWVAARTDPELRATLAKVERSLVDNTLQSIPTLFGERAARPGFTHRLEDVLSAMRGLAIRRVGVADRDASDRQWERMRPWLAARLDERA